MNNRGQSALEYLMTYGWALIVVAVIIGILIYVTSGATGGVTCQSSNNQIMLKETVFASGANGVGFTLQNVTGGKITLVADCAPAADAVGIVAAGTDECTAGDVASTATFTVKNLTGPATGTVTNNKVKIIYKTEGLLDGSATITCNGKI